MWTGHVFSFSLVRIGPTVEDIIMSQSLQHGLALFHAAQYWMDHCHSSTTLSLQHGLTICGVRIGRIQWRDMAGTITIYGWLRMVLACGNRSMLIVFNLQLVYSWQSPGVGWGLRCSKAVGLIASSHLCYLFTYILLYLSLITGWRPRYIYLSSRLLVATFQHRG